MLFPSGIVIGLVAQAIQSPGTNIRNFLGKKRSWSINLPHSSFADDLDSGPAVQWG